MDIYDIKIDIFQEVARLPAFVERFIEWYGGMKFFYYEMAFYYRADRDRRVQRGEDRARAVKMAEEMVNDLVLFLAKEYCIWDTRIQVIESYPDASVITKEFVEFYGGLEKLREDMMPFFKLDCERRIESFKEKPSVAKFMAGTVVNWMTIRLARENGFLDTKKKELPHFKFPSLKRDSDYEDIILKESPTVATVVEQGHNHNNKTPALEKWPGAFGTRCTDESARCLIKDGLPLIGRTYSGVDLKTRFLTKAAQVASLFSREYVQALLHLRLFVGTLECKPSTHIKPATWDSIVTTDKAMTSKSSGSLNPAITKPWQRSAFLPINSAMNYIGQRMARKFTDRRIPGGMTQHITGISSLDSKLSKRALISTTSFLSNQVAIDLTTSVPMTTNISRVSSLMTTIVLYPSITASLHIDNYRPNLPLVQRDTAHLIPNERLSSKTPKQNTCHKVNAKPKRVSFQIDEPLISNKISKQNTCLKITTKPKRVRFQIDEPIAPKNVDKKDAYIHVEERKKTSTFSRLRKLFRKMCCAGNKTDDE